jgi:hypothetical protein
MLQTIIAALLAAALGAAFCFAGYRVFLVLLPIWGFFAGFWIGAEGVSLIFGSGFLATSTGWIVGFILGLFCALFSYMFYIIGVAIVAAGFGAALGSGLLQAVGFDPGLLTGIIALVSAIIFAGATLLLNLQKYVIILITAIGGANALLVGPLMQFGHIDLRTLSVAGNSIKPILQDSWFWLFVWLVIATSGVLVQIRANKKYTFTRDRFREGWG